MELEDLKNIWEEQSTQQSQEINKKFLKEVSFKKSKSKLGEFTIENSIELVFNFILGFYSIHFVMDSALNAKYTIPALVVIILIVISIYWNFYSLRFVTQMNYNTPIVELQRKLVNIRKYTQLEARFMLFLLPLYIISLGIVLLQGLFNIDAYALVNEFGILGYVLLNAMIAGIIVWLIVRNEYKRFDEVNDFLTTIEHFEKAE